MTLIFINITSKNKYDRLTDVGSGDAFYVFAFPGKSC